MKASEAILEFLIPGILATTGFLLMLGGICQLTGVDIMIHISTITKQGVGLQSIFGFFFLSISYVMGILCSNLVGMMLKGIANKKLIYVFDENSISLRKAGINQLVGSEPSQKGWNTKQAMRLIKAYTSANSEAAERDVQAHTKHVRIVRSTILGVTLMFIGLNVAFWSIKVLPFNAKLIICGLATLVGFGTLMTLVDSYFYRLGLLYSTSIAYFVALQQAKPSSKKGST